MSGELEYLKKKMEYFRSKIVNNDDGELFCIKCGAEDELIEDDYNEEVYYCFECLERARTHDEMVYEGFEESDGSSD